MLKEEEKILKLYNVMIGNLFQYNCLDGGDVYFDNYKDALSVFEVNIKELEAKLAENNFMTDYDNLCLFVFMMKRFLRWVKEEDFEELF